MSKIASACAVLLVLASACREKPAPTARATSATPTSATSAASASAGDASTPSVLWDPRRFDCAKDSDCTASCAYGAVNAGWYARAQGAAAFSECDDGCDSAHARAPRCEAGGCVAYWTNPNTRKVEVHSACTRVQPRDAGG